MTLLLAPRGMDLQISRIRNKYIKDEKQRRHLCNMGFVEGAKVSVVTECDGNLIIKIKECRVGIGKDIARGIMVEEMVS